ncbi:MAG: peptide deformylase [Deltaproteobacteria bacterium]
MILPIRIWPDPVLQKMAEPVSQFNAELAELVQNMFETMYDAPGRGLAAPQIGVSKRLFVMDCTWKDGDKTPRVFINPEILNSDVEMTVNSEGCLSLPEFTVDVERPISVEIKWQDLEGAFHQDALTGFAAICAQHEYDHLDGILTIDRITAPQLEAIADCLANLRACV